MKKIYQAPLMKVVSTKCASMLCSSATTTEKVTVSENIYDDNSWE